MLQANQSPNICKRGGKNTTQCPFPSHTIPFSLFFSCPLCIILLDPHLQSPIQPPLLPSNKLPSLQLKPHIHHHSHKQTNTKRSRPKLIMIFNRLPRPNRLTAIQIRNNRIEERQDRHKGKGSSSEEGQFRCLSAKVEERRCDGRDVDGEFELGWLAGV